MINSETLRSPLRILLILMGLMTFVGCGTSEDIDPVVPCTVTNTCPPPPPPPPQVINLSQFSIAKASSEFERVVSASFKRKDYKSHFVRDGLIGNTAKSWHSNAEGNSALITLTFPAEVKLDRVELWDNTDTKYNLQAGFLSFINTLMDPRPNISDINYGVLPSNGAQAVSLKYTDSNPVTELTLHITDFEDLDPNYDGNPFLGRSGLAEIKAFGRFVDKDMERKNIARFSIPDEYSGATSPVRTEVKHYIQNDGSTTQDETRFEDFGNFGPFNAIDDEALGENCESLSANRDSFKSQGAGSNTRLKLNFGRMYKVDKVVVYDLQHATSDAHIKDFRLKFSDGTEIADKFDDIDHPLCKIVNLATAKKTTFIQLSVTDFDNATDATGNTDVGIAEIKVFGTYEKP